MSVAAPSPSRAVPVLSTTGNHVHAHDNGNKHDCKKDDHDKGDHDDRDKDDSEPQPRSQRTTAKYRPRATTTLGPHNDRRSAAAQTRTTVELLHDNCNASRNDQDYNRDPEATMRRLGLGPQVIHGHDDRVEGSNEFVQSSSTFTSSIIYLSAR